MTISDWIIDVALILVVVRQLREERLTIFTFLIPLALVGWVTDSYLRHVPTAGDDLVLTGTFAAVGVALGLAGGLLTRVRFADGHIRIRATWAAAGLWVLSMGFRLGFAVWSSHPSGMEHLARFSAAHDITDAQAWVAALILMALGEVTVRLGVIAVRGRLLHLRTVQRPRIA